MPDQNHIANLFDEGQRWLDDGKPLHALQSFRQITELDPGNALAWIQLSTIYSELKNVRAAEAALLKALGGAAHPKEMLILLGDLHFRSNRLGRALFFYRKALLSEQSLSRSARCKLHYNIGRALLMQRQVRPAESHFRRVRSLDPHYPRIDEVLGELLLRRKAVTEALAVLRNAVGANPYSPVAHFLLGKAYAQAEDWLRAYDEFVSAVDMDPGEPNAWRMCGEALLSLHRLDEAEKYLRKALDLDPQSSDAVADFGFLYLCRNDRDRARSYFEKALANEPGNKRALLGQSQLNGTGR
jgi:Flp pilus assembly protein TadD